MLQHSILPYAFAVSEYPVILSIENHLSAEQQEVFARSVVEILGDYLYRGKVDNMNQLPSPNQLRRKIIIKANPAKLQSKAMKDLVSICYSIKINGVDYRGLSDQFYHLNSLSEEKALEKCKHFKEEVLEHTRRQLVRIYPSCIRIASSNYSPSRLLCRFSSRSSLFKTEPFLFLLAVAFWKHGLQLLALNYQTGDKNLAANLGLFRRNGSCGYVLKPAFLLDRAAPRMPPMTIELMVLSGQNFPRTFGLFKSPTVCPFVNIRVDDEHDVTNAQTSTICRNGLNPVWADSFTFNIKCPELALITFTVCDSDLFNIGHDVLGVFALPIQSIAPGYRHIPLANSHGDFLPGSSIFVKCQIS